MKSHNTALNRSAVTMRFYFQLSGPRPVSFTLGMIYAPTRTHNQGDADNEL